MRVTGNMMNYYKVCKRKLWFFSKNLTMENNSDLVHMGKIIDEYSYDREKKSILIDETICLDFQKDFKIIKEVKKSKSIDLASEFQVKYYIYYLRNLGVNIEKAIIHYPLLRNTREVFLEEIDRNEIEETIKEIEKIIAMKIPPKEENYKYCKYCSYYEMCKI